MSRSPRSAAPRLARAPRVWVTSDTPTCRAVAPNRLSWAASVRVCYLISRRRGPQTGRPPPEGVHVVYPLCFQLWTSYETLGRIRMTLRTLYLQKMLSINGRDALRGRSLYDRFRHLSDETLLGHLVLEDEVTAAITDQRLKADLVSHALLRDFQPNVVFIEGGLFADSDGTWKIPEAIAREICQSGDVLIAADVDHDELRNHKAHYRSAAALFMAHASYGRDDDDDPVYGSDLTHSWRGQSPFAAVRLRTAAAKRFKKVENARA
jgi:hypothetical protein